MDESTLKWAFKKHLQPYVLSFFKVDESFVKSYYNSYIKEQPNGDKYNFLWALYQHLIIETSKLDLTIYELNHAHSMIYFHMATFRRTYEDVLANDIFQLALDCSVNSYEPVDGFKMAVSIITATDCCDYCNSMNGKRIDIEDMLLNKPYQAIICTNNRGCRTTFAYVPSRDKNGRLIRT